MEKNNIKIKLKLVSPYKREVYERNARLCQILANAKRLEILNILKLQPTTVNRLAEALKIRKANVSQHLSLLRTSRLVLTERVGQNVVYRLVDPLIVQACRILKDLHEQKLI